VSRAETADLLPIADHFICTCIFNIRNISAIDLKKQIAVLSLRFRLSVVIYHFNIFHHV
jgi:hypothetical protein